LRPSIQSSSRNRCTSAAVHWLWAEGVVEPRKPMVGSFPGCCARVASGQVAAAPPSSEINSRRLMCSLRLRVTLYHTVLRYCVVHHSKFWPPMTGSGQERRIRPVCNTPRSRHRSGHPKSTRWDSCTAAKLHHHHHHHSITSSAPTSCTARDQGRDQRVSRIRRLVSTNSCPPLPLCS
jgi:hypothetical protein